MGAQDELKRWHVIPWWSAGTGLGGIVALVLLQPASVSFWRDAVFEKAPFIYPDRGQAYADIVVALVGLSLLAAVVHVMQAFRIRRSKSIAPMGEPLSVSLEFTSQVLISPLLFALYLSGSAALRDSLESRWSGYNRATYTGVVIHTAMDLLGTVLFVALKKEPLLFVHHALTLTVFGTAALSGFGHHYCALGGLVELTNLFTFGIASGPAVRIAPGSMLHTTCGALLWLSFTVLRVIIHPYNLFSYASEAYQHPELTIMPHPPSLRYTGGPAYVAIFLMSMLWYYKITKGMLKALGINSAAGAKQD